MQQYLKTYRIKLRTQGPVFVGNGKELSKKEYLFLNNGNIGIMDISKMYALMAKKNLLPAFEDFMVNDARNDLRRWMQEKRIDKKEYLSCIRYSVEQGDTTLQRGRKLQIMECIKDPYGLPYLPGSTLKGMLRTILLSNELLKKNGEVVCQAEQLVRKVERTDGKINRNSYLKREVKQVETAAFHTLDREKTKKEDAVNDILSGFIVSDSNPVSIEQLVMCQRWEYHTNGTERTINMLRECIKPGVEIYFDLTIDEKRCNITIEELLKAIERVTHCYNKCFIHAFKEINEIPINSVYVGGGTGYVSKTITYPMLGKERGIPFTKKIFEDIKVPRNHKHDLDKEYGASPHILKCTKYAGKLYQMGLCSLTVES